MPVSWPELLVLCAAVALGCCAQAIVGFGANLIAVPIVAIVAPAALPTTMVVVTAPMTVSMLLHERGHIDRRGFLFVSLGRVPGTVLGVAVVAVATDRLLAGLAGAITLAGVALTLLANRHDVTPANAAAAGTVAGFTGTAAAIDGPPLALLFQHEPPETLRSTLAACFVLASVMSFTGLAIGGQVRAWQLGLALALLPAVALGLGLGAWLRRYVARRVVRPALLVLVTAAGLVALLRALA